MLVYLLPSSMPFFVLISVFCYFPSAVMHSGWNCSWRVNFAEWPLRHPIHSTTILDWRCFSHTSIVGQGWGTRKTCSRRVMITKAPSGVHLTCIYQHPACPCGWMKNGSHGYTAWRDLAQNSVHRPPTEEPVLPSLEHYSVAIHHIMNEWTWKAECPLDKLL